MPLASARQHPENQKENQAGRSSERAVEGQLATPAAELWFFVNEQRCALFYDTVLPLPRLESHFTIFLQGPWVFDYAFFSF